MNPVQIARNARIVNEILKNQFVLDKIVEMANNKIKAFLNKAGGYWDENGKLCWKSLKTNLETTDIFKFIGREL